MKDIVIIGAGGFGREVQWLIEDINSSKELPEWNILGYIDDNIEDGKLINGKPVLGNIEYLQYYKEKLCVVCAIGKSSVKKYIIEKLEENRNLTFPNLIHPTVVMSKSVELGKGNIICAGNILTVDISIKDFCMLNLSSTIGHDVIIENFVTICPGCNISGYSYLGECVEIGTGTQILQGISIGDNTIIGANSMVNHNIAEDCTAVGSPCKPIKFNSGGVR